MVGKAALENATAELSKALKEAEPSMEVLAAYRIQCEDKGAIVAVTFRALPNVASGDELMLA